MITLDPKTTALVLIDLQNGILGRKLEPISAADLVERGKTLAGRFRAVGALVVLVNVAPAMEEPPRRVDEPSTLPKILPEGFIDLAPGLAEPAISKSPRRAGARFPSPSSTSSSANAACVRSRSAASPPSSASNPPRGRRGSSATSSSSSRTRRAASRLKPTTIRCADLSPDRAHSRE